MQSVPMTIKITEVRMALEGLCAAKAAETATGDEVAELTAIGERMRAAVAAGDVLGYSQLNQELHRHVREISGQRTVCDVLERLRAQNVRHQFRLAMQPGRLAVSLPEHLAIVEAIAAGDPVAAEDAARAHLRSVIAALREVDSARLPKVV